jgi:hypothetical protein
MLMANAGHLGLILQIATYADSRSKLRLLRKPLLFKPLNASAQLLGQR